MLQSNSTVIVKSVMIITPFKTVMYVSARNQKQESRILMKLEMELLP